MLQKVDLFLSSDERGEDTYSVGYLRKSSPQSLEALVRFTTAV
jgi:hypothetical protein